jgi:hypothetical protein
MFSFPGCLGQMKFYVLHRRRTKGVDDSGLLLSTAAVNNMAEHTIAELVLLLVSTPIMRPKGRFPKGAIRRRLLRYFRAKHMQNGVEGCFEIFGFRSTK